jgi:hypothetical protein
MENRKAMHSIRLDRGAKIFLGAAVVIILGCTAGDPGPSTSSGPAKVDHPVSSDRGEVWYVDPNGSQKIIIISDKSGSKIAIWDKKAHQRCRARTSSQTGEHYPECRD